MLVEASWVPLDVRELLALNTVLMLEVDGEMLLDMILEDVALLEPGEEKQYIEDEDEYIIDDDEPIAGEELTLVEAIWVPLDVRELLSLITVLTVVVDGAMLLDMAILEEE